MRLAPFTVLLMVVYLCIGLVDHTFMTGSDNLSSATSASTGSSFWEIFFQPYNWSGTSLIYLLGTAFVVAAGAAAFTSIFAKSDITALYGIFLAFVALGAFPITSIYLFVTRNVAAYAGCTIGNYCMPSMIFGALIAGTLAIYWVFVCVEWWAWRPTTQ